MQYKKQQHKLSLISVSSLEKTVCKGIERARRRKNDINNNLSLEKVLRLYLQHLSSVISRWCCSLGYTPDKSSANVWDEWLPEVYQSWTGLWIHWGSIWMWVPLIWPTTLWMSRTTCCQDWGKVRRAICKNFVWQRRASMWDSHPACCHTYTYANPWLGSTHWDKGWQRGLNVDNHCRDDKARKSR